MHSWPGLGVHVVYLGFAPPSAPTWAAAREVVPARCARLPMVAIPMVKSAVTATLTPLLRAASARQSPGRVHSLAAFQLHLIRTTKHRHLASLLHFYHLLSSLFIRLPSIPILLGINLLALTRRNSLRHPTGPPPPRPIHFAGRSPVSTSPTLYLSRTTISLLAISSACLGLPL